MRVCIEGVAES